MYGPLKLTIASDAQRYYDEPVHEVVSKADPIALQVIHAARQSRPPAFIFGSEHPSQGDPLTAALGDMAQAMQRPRVGGVPVRREIKQLIGHNRIQLRAMVPNENGKLVPKYRWSR